jgi:hypothetical protein
VLTRISYLITDYTRSNFSIFQTVFPSTNNFTEHIIPIYPPSTPSKHHMSPVILGSIIAPTAILLITLIYCTFILHRRRKRAALELARAKFPGLAGPQAAAELGPTEIVVELIGEDAGVEMEGEGRHELRQTGLFELSSDNLYSKQDST